MARMFTDQPGTAMESTKQRVGSDAFRDPDPARLFRRPRTLGWEFRSPPETRHGSAGSPAEQLETLRKELLKLQSEESAVADMRRRFASRRADPALFFAVAGTALLAGILVFNNVAGSTLLLVASLAFFVYSWPYISVRDDRQSVKDFDKRKTEVARSIKPLEDFERKELDRLARVTMWHPVPCPRSGERLELFGGNKVGWEAFLLTYGSSVLGSSGRLFVLDVTERHVAAHLAKVAVASGRNVQYLALPEQAAELDLFDGLSTDEIVECIVSAWHDVESTSTSRADLTRDIFVLERVCDCLQGGKLTLRRLDAALLVLLSIDDADPQASVLTETEELRLGSLFGDHLRTGMQFTDRLLAIAAFIKQLNSAAGAEPTLVTLAKIEADLTLLELTATGQLADKRALAAVIVQILQVQLARRQGTSSLPTDLVVASADLLGRSSLERLARFATDSGIQTAYMFESMRSSGAEIIGMGEATQLFMRMRNRTDAERAANHLGRERKFVLSQWSTSESDSVTETYGEQVTKSHGSTLGLMSVNIGRVPILLPSTTVNSGTQRGTSWGKQTGKTKQNTKSYSRVHEPTVEPEVLQHLGQYVILSQLTPDSLTAIDCDPELANAPSNELPAA